MSPDGDSRSVTTTADSVQLPEAGISEILGLVELLNSKGGREDIYKLAAELNMEFGDTLKVIRGAEILKLVHTPGGDVVLEPLGEDVTRSKIAERKQIIKEQVEKIPVIKKVCSFLKEQDDHEVTRDEMLKKLAELIPNEDAEKSFNIIVQLGRYAELFGYNDDAECFYLDSGEEAS